MSHRQAVALEISEGQGLDTALGAIKQALNQLRQSQRVTDRSGPRSVAHDLAIAIGRLEGVEQILVALGSQVAAGVHTNPPLVIYGNPPLRARAKDMAKFRSGMAELGGAGRFHFVGQIGRDVHEIRYTHVDDGQDYKHGFTGDDAEMFAIVRGDRHRDVLVTSRSGKALWGEFS